MIPPPRRAPACVAPSSRDNAASTDGPVPAAVTVRVSGTSSFSGRSTFVIEKNDPLGHGFALPLSYNDLMKRDPNPMADHANAP